jgi:hypothetical protein
MKTDSLREYRIQEAIIDVLIDVCPKESLDRCVSILPSATSQISSLEQLVNELGIVANVGLTSHTMIQMRSFLRLGDDFRNFTRDYIRRCCDLIEHLAKFPLATKYKVDVKNKPLGPAIQALERSGLPEGLVEKLTVFNAKVYCPAKHEMPHEDRHMYSVADAVAVTFACLVLAREISSHVSGSPQKTL